MRRTAPYILLHMEQRTMNIIADTHCHTLACSHAYSKLSRMVHASAVKGLYGSAFTGHEVTKPGAPGKW